MRQGKSLELLVAHLEQVVAENDGVTITSPKKLRDRITGRLREHDVVISIKRGHHECQIAIECRDRSRRITVNQVEGFYKKCEDTGVQQGIIVSTKGFYETARTKAAHYGIRCFDLEQTKSFDWFLPSNMEFCTTNIISIHWTLIPIVDTENSLKDFILIDKNNIEIKKSLLIKNAHQEFAKLSVDLFPGRKQHNINFNANNISILDKITKEQIPLKNIIANIEYEVVKEYVPFNLFKYAEKGADKEFANAALATQELEGAKIKFMFLRNENQTVSLWLLAEVDKSP